MRNKSQSGQTLIETVVAVFIMSMGITAALGLATFAFNASSNTSKQIIAMGLAREGVEAIINARDSNWLKGASISSDCYNFANSPADQTGYCYKDWLNPGGSKGYDLTPPSGTKTFRLNFGPAVESAQGVFWDLQSTPNKFGLNYDSTGTNGFYIVPNGGTSNGTSDYFREITLSYDTTAPYNTSGNNDIGPMLIVKSQVWWKDRKCPTPTQTAPSGGPCQITLETHLTNWKNY